MHTSKLSNAATNAFPSKCIRFVLSRWRHDARAPPYNATTLSYIIVVRMRHHCYYSPIARCKSINQFTLYLKNVRSCTLFRFSEMKKKNEKKNSPFIRMQRKSITTLHFERVSLYNESGRGGIL